MPKYSLMYQDNAYNIATTVKAEQIFDFEL